MSHVVESPTPVTLAAAPRPSRLRALATLLERWYGRPTRLPRRAWPLVMVLFVGWVASVAYTATTVSWSDLASIAPFALGTALARRYRIGLYDTRSHVNLATVTNISAGILFGIPGVIIPASLGLLVTPTKRGAPGLMFNLGSIGLSNVFAVLVYQAAIALPGPILLRQSIGALAAGASVHLGETWLVALIIKLTEGRSARQVWTETSRWLLPHMAIMGLVGLGMALTYEALAITGLVAFAGPALLLRYSIKQYLDRTTTSVNELRERNTALQQANDEIGAMSVRLQETYIGTLQALVAALDTRDNESYGHSMRVAKLTMVLAAEIGVGKDSREWIDIERGALLHDVGKIGVPDAILRKPASLTTEEWAEMRGHARLGFEMLRDIPFLTAAAQVVIAHHERWDGQGYPRGLVGEEIPLGARIFMLADTFDAMASDRPYRKARSYDECLAEITRCAGTQFDPAAVAALQEVFPQWVEIHRTTIAQGKKERIIAVA